MSILHLLNSLLRKEATPPVTLESFKRAPGEVLMDEHGYAGLSPEAVDQIERLRKSKGWGIQVGSAPATAWWQRLLRRKVTAAGKSDMPLKLKVVPLSPTRHCSYVPDAPSSPGMSHGILRPILRPLAARGRSDRWPR